MSKTTWTRTEDGIYSNGTIEIRRMDSTARSRFSWVLFRNGVPVTRTTRSLGRVILTGSTLSHAKDLVRKHFHSNGEPVTR